MKLFFFAALFALFFLAGYAQLSTHRDSQICGPVTCKKGTKFKYNPGTVHSYKYYVNVSSLFEGTSKNESNLYITAQIDLEFISKCEGLLVINDANLNHLPIIEQQIQNEYGDYEEIKPEPEEGEENDEEKGYMFSEALTEYNLRFSYHDGIITELCPNEEEKNWVLNFKRGILSMLQNTMNRLDLDHKNDEEEDVMGKCKTTYTLMGAKETSLIIEKKKDLDSCTSRSKMHSIIQSTPYNFRPVHKSVNLLKSSSECILSVDHNIYNEITCEEVHLFRPFSNKAAGATTKIKQRLLLESESPKLLDEQEDVRIRTNLLFDQVPSPKPTIGELRESRNQVKKLCKMQQDEVQSDFSDVFTTFIHTARVLNEPTLQALYEHSGNICSSGKKHILDALPFLGSSASITLMKNIILAGEIREDLINDWMVSLALTVRPDEVMMEAVSELLKNRIYNTSVALAVSSMTYTYCRQNEGCQYQSSVNEIVSLFEEHLKNNLAQKNNDNQEIILALKSLANIGFVFDETKEEVLYKMVLDDNLDPAIRVTAVEVFRRLPCQQDMQFFSEIFSNSTQDTEVRIASYLQMMRCPSYESMDHILQVLEVEEVNQVGSFVWSHLTNLLKSSIPPRVEIQGILSDRDLKKKFSSDVRKFSHNFEGDIFFEEYNFGANYDSNVIFSPSSYVPRSAMLNFTVELFGESINLLEVYGRLEGFEYYLESIFGPTGRFSSNKIQQKFPVPKVRWARSAKEDNEVINEIEKLPNIPKENQREPKVALGMKIFGNDLKYASYKGHEDIAQALKSLNVLDNIKQILSGKEIKYSKASMFLDCSYVIPSGAGLPLTLNAIGTTSVNVKMFGDLQMQDFIKTNKLDLKGNLSPSVAVDVIGTMSVDAFYLTSGMRLKTNVYTSGAIQGNVSINGADLVSVKFSLPKETTEIFGARSELILLKNNKEVPEQGVISSKKKIQHTACSWPAVEQTIGLKLCGSFHIVNVTREKNSPYFILSGPSGIRVFINKLDPSAKTYALEYKRTHFKTHSLASLTFDTPGSKMRRVLNANMTMDSTTKNLTVLLESSMGTVLATGKIKNTDYEKYLQFGIKINDKSHFDTLLSLTKTDVKNGVVISPKFHLSVNNENVADLEGDLKQLTKSGITQIDVALLFKTKRMNSTLNGYLMKSEASIGADLNLHYTFKGMNKQTVKWYLYLTNKSRNTLVSVLGNCLVEASAYPNVNFNATLKILKSQGHIESNLLVVSSPNLHKLSAEEDTQRITFESTLSYRTMVNNTRFNFETTLKRPSRQLDLGASFLLETSDHNTNVVTAIKYGTNKDIVVSAYVSRPKQALESMEGKLNVTIPGFESMILRGKIKEKNPKDYLIEISAIWFSSHKIDAIGVYQDKSGELSSEHHLKVILRSPSFQEINASLHFFQDDLHFHVNVKADQNEDSYQLVLKHYETSPWDMKTEVKLKYKQEMYSLVSTISMKEISLEIHLDKLRDLHFKIYAENKPLDTSAGFEFKWDANRDPTQKLLVTIDLTRKPAEYYRGNLVITYPGRTINGIYNLQFEEGHFETLGRISWSDEQSFAVHLIFDHSFVQETYMKLRLDIITPIEEWKRTTLVGSYKHKGNLYDLQSKLSWQNKHQVAMNIFADYTFDEEIIHIVYNAGITSTVPDLPTIQTSMKHNQTANKIFSDFYLKYYPDKKVVVKNEWDIKRDVNGQDLLGSVTISTPFTGYSTVFLKGKIRTTKTRDVYANIDLNVRPGEVYNGILEAHLLKISDSMLMFNVTTPDSKKIRGRFGYSEPRRHVVAMIEYPTGSAGIELLLQINSITDFDTKFQLATPVDLLQNLLIIGKLKHDRMDLRVGWNNLLIGFNGVWHYANLKDFEYKYVVYTPLDGFDENGIVAKVILKEEEGIDTEFSINLADARVGFSIFAQPNPKPPVLNIYKEKSIPFRHIMFDDAAEEDEEEEDGAIGEENDDEIKPLSWEGNFVLDAIIVPTIKGEGTLNQRGKSYLLAGLIKVPEGIVTVNDEFIFENFGQMYNVLTLKTPYPGHKEVKLNWDLEIAMNEMYFTSLEYITTGNLKNYNVTSGSIFVQTNDWDEDYLYNITLNVKTPAPAFPFLNIQGSLQREEEKNNALFAMLTKRSNISFSGDLQMSEQLFNGKASFHVLSPSVTLPPIDIYIKKNLTKPEHSFLFEIDVWEQTLSKYKLDTVWKYDSLKNCKGKLQLWTPLKGMNYTEIAGEVASQENNLLATGTLILEPINIRFVSSVIEDKVNATAFIDYNKKKTDLRLYGILLPVDKNKYDFAGVITNDKASFNVTGNIFSKEGVPVDMTYEVRPVKGGSPITIRYNFQAQPKGHAVKCQIKQGRNFGNFEMHSTITNNFDWDIRLHMDSNHPQHKNFLFHAKAHQVGKNNKTLSVVCKTSLPKLEHSQLSVSHALLSDGNHADISYGVGDSKGAIKVMWNWLFMENMVARLNGDYQTLGYHRKAATEIFYINNQKSFKDVKLGGNVRINDTWLMGTNLTMVKQGDKQVISAFIDLPQPLKNTHSFKGELEANNVTNHYVYSGAYKSTNSKLIYASSGDVTYKGKEYIVSKIDLTWGLLNYDTFLDYKTINNKTDVLFKLKMPKKEKLLTRVSYQPWKDFHNMTCQIEYPETNKLADAKINFKEFSNMDGDIRLNNPFKGVNFTNVEFLTVTTGYINDRYIKLSWPKDHAYLNATRRTEMGKSVLERQTKGLVLIEVPIQTRHKAIIDYNYSEKEEKSGGEAQIKYNGNKIVEGKYTKHSVSKAGFDEDTIHMEVKNPILPLGLDYIHGYEFSSAEKGSNLPTVDSKQFHVFHLKNQSIFNITGQINIKSEEAGQAINLMLHQSNRTIKFFANYESKDHLFKQKSILELNPKAWFMYDLSLFNKTTRNVESQQILLDIGYPLRNFTFDGIYKLYETKLTSEIGLTYDHERKRHIKSQFDWFKSSDTKQEVALIFRHPSFEKDVTLRADYDSKGRRLINAGLTVDYSHEEKKLFQIRGIIDNNSQRNQANYTYTLKADHGDTNLDLNTRGGFFVKNRWYNIKHLVDYTRTYMPSQNGEIFALLDVDNNEIELKRFTMAEMRYFKGKYQGHFPMYMVNVSAIYKQDINATGYSYVNFADKVLKMDLNITEDGSKSAHMHGYIPDSRNILFDMWRQYEDVKITDMAYFLRLNHSRLIVAKLVWRPELIFDIRTALSDAAKAFYNDLIETADHWKEYVRAETGEAITDIWKNAQPSVQEFLDDVRDLNVIEEDFEALKIFVNTSYTNNEFYIQDIAKICTYIVDELALRSHIESLPAIINEIWDVMGESGKKIQKSVQWIIETLKQYYQNASDFLHKLVHGESLETFSEALKSLVEKYDNIIKEIHVSFIKYVEQLWDQTYILIINYWHRTLAALEPTFIAFAHYVETFVWSTGQDFLDFLYKKAEIVESPYFAKLTNFTADVDKFYKDMTGNNSFANGLKYTAIVTTFLKDKYFKLVPFATELDNVVSEIVQEVEELKKLPSVMFVLQRIERLFESLKWYYDYFEMHEKLQEVMTVVNLKLTDLKQTALEAENKYRKAKTKFIFDPWKGIMHLEQKLPMSWHAFDENPKFEEIPELKMLNDLKKDFSGTKISFANFYYDYKPYMDPSDWLPPFKAQAVIVNGKNIITFDKKMYEFDGTSSYLLASDFIDRNFSLAVSFKHNKGKLTHQLLAIIDKTVINIDLQQKAVYYGAEKKSLLPVQIGNAHLYREADIVTLESYTGFKLQCNFLFDICTFEVSGWYFGKTAGLFGTINNEIVDDMTSSNGIRMKDVNEFTRSWALNTPIHVQKNRLTQNTNLTMLNMCKSFFTAKVSNFQECFPRIDPKPYFEVCLKTQSAKEACAVALAYMNMCAFDNTLMRIPESCVACNLGNGTSVKEGTFITLEEDVIPKSADVVFIVEAKACNKDLRQKRHIDVVVEQLDKELNNVNIRNNKYAVVMFGGDNVHNTPRSYIMNDKVFTDHKGILPYFQHIPAGNGSADIFGAITYASRLIFRPGVSKTIILIPCSHCYESDMKLDHAILHQLMSGSDIKMHILMNDDFHSSKQKLKPMLYGIDQSMAYTRKDADKFAGDNSMRKHVKVPKSSLGICAPLALEIQGSVFSAKKLEGANPTNARKFATVFAKRVAKSAKPNMCKYCECTAYNSGVSYMECLSCNYPMPGIPEFENEEDMLKLMQEEGIDFIEE